MADLIVQPARSLQGSLTLPGDKSISHRALLVGALCQGPVRIENLLDADDVRRSRGAIESLGVPVRVEGSALVVEGRGLRGLKAPAGALEMGNSGTTTRLLLGILAGFPFEATLTGDASLSARPMRRVTEPLEKMGASVHGLHGKDRLPLTLRGGRLRGIRHTLAVPSAQVKSALLLAGLFADGPTTVVEPAPTRDHTERLLAFLGANVEVASSAPEPALSAAEGGPPRNDVITSAEGAKQSRITIYPGAVLQARMLEVPGDFSSAAFFLVAAAIVPGSEVTARRVGLNPTRTALLGVLRQMGAHISVIASAEGAKQSPWEPVGDVTVRGSELQAVSVAPSDVPALIDEFPILMAAATQARGVTRMEGLGELRVKETDRIRSMVQGLSRMGAEIRSEGDTVIVEGPSALRGAVVDSLGDHRTAMALAIAGLAAQGETKVREAEWVDISFPGFAQALAAIRR